MYYLAIGWYLIEFYTAFSADICFNTTNQNIGFGIIIVLIWQHLSWFIHSADLPSDILEQVALHHYLFTFCQWMPLMYENTNVHRPFKLTSINGWNTHDHFADADWNILHAPKLCSWMNHTVWTHPCPPFKFIEVSPSVLVPKWMLTYCSKLQLCTPTLENTFYADERSYHPNPHFVQHFPYQFNRWHGWR